MAKLAGVIKAQDFDKETIEKIFTVAEGMEQNRPTNLLRPYIMASLFCEESTRTRLSFDTSMLRLGGRFVSSDNFTQFSSLAKGERLEDSMRVISGYVDTIVLRYKEEGGAKIAQKHSLVPVINAGD